MRWGFFLSLLIVSAALLAPIASGDDGPSWALISTEVDENPGPGFMDRQVLKLDQPNYEGPGSLFFDPGTEIFGVETGLDAISLLGGLICFSTEVDVMYEGALYTDQQLLTWNGATLSPVAAVETAMGYLGDDYGLDAACYTDAAWIISTEVGYQGPNASFTDGDLLIVYQDGSFRVFDVMRYFGENVGLDALHARHWNATDTDPERFEINMSTEVDGVIWDPNSQTFVDFNNEDILSLQLTFGPTAADWLLERVEKSWVGVDKMGSDVGLDALYIQFPDEGVPEPATMAIALVGFGLAGLGGRLRRRS